MRSQTFLPAAISLALCVSAQTPLPTAARFVIQPVPERFDLGTVTVTALAQDHSGFLWVGTQSGLLRYDGGQVIRYGRESGLPTAFIDQLEVSDDGTLWVGTNDGVARFKEGKFTALPLPEGSKVDAVFQILAPGPKGGVFVGTRRGLLYLSPDDPKANRVWDRRNGLPCDAIGALRMTPAGLYFSCEAHVFLLERVEGAPAILNAEIPKEPGERTVALFLDSSRNLWVRTAAHVFRLADGGKAFEQDDDDIPKANDFGIPALDRSGALMIPSTRGLFRRVNRRWELTSESNGLDSNAVFAALEDRTGALWIGYGGAGLARWAGSKWWSGWTKAEGLPDNVVWCVQRDRRNRLWAGTDNGLAMWDPAQAGWRKFSEREGLAGNTVRQLAVGNDGWIWAVSIPGGVSFIDPITLRIHRAPFPPQHGPVAGLAVAPDGRVLAGNYGTLQSGVRRGDSVQWSEIPVPREAAGTTSHPVYAPDGTLWTSGRNGISRLDGNGWRVFQKADGLKSNVVPSVVPVNANEIWFRYIEPLGLGHLRVSGNRSTVEHITKHDGLSDDSVFLLGVDQTGKIWAGGSRGVNVVDPRGAIHGFTRADGLIWNDLSSGSFWTDPDGTVYLGTSRGLASVRPDAGLFDPPPALVEITSARLDGRSFTARFADLSFRDSERTICRYQMEGLDAGYTETTQREAHYPSIPGGNYRFSVSCRPPGQSWSTAVRAEVAVPLAWWERWWARSLGLLLVAGGASILSMLRMRAIRADRDRLEAAVAARSAELARANKELAEASLTDALTKTRNRRYFQMIIETEVQRALRSKEDLILIFVELDHFEAIKNQVGHAEGDEILTHVANRMLSIIRGADTLVRWGGEEFLILARGTSRRDAPVLVSRILDATGRDVYTLDDGRSMQCTCSAGFTAFPWSHDEPNRMDIAEVIRIAGQALYMAKETGRNRAVGLLEAGTIHCSGPGVERSVSA